MRSRIIVGVLVTVALVGAASFSARASSSATSDQKWSIVNFRDPVSVAGQLVMGPVLIVHDDSKMAHGEPCTTFYRFDPATGPKEVLASFHCVPKQTDRVAATTLTTYASEAGCRKLIEYQIAGDSEAHVVPDREDRAR